MLLLRNIALNPSVILTTAWTAATTADTLFSSTEGLGVYFGGGSVVTGAAGAATAALDFDGDGDRNFANRSLNLLFFLSGELALGGSWSNISIIEPVVKLR